MSIIYAPEGFAKDLTDLMLIISRGDLPGYSFVNKFGRNDDIDPATDPEDVWDAGGIWVPPTTARLHNIVSTDANDTALGTGARTVQIEGLDSSYNEQSEVVTMNGITNVATVNTYTRIYRMYAVSAGSLLTNAGTITATAQTDLTVTAQISLGLGQTLMAIYTVPAGKTAFMTNIYATMSKPGGTQAATVDMQVRSRGPVDVATSPWRVKQYGYLTLSGSRQLNNNYLPYKVFTEKTDIVLRSEVVTVQNVRVTGGFDLILVDNTV
jgi:hypothetical protein